MARVSRGSPSTRRFSARRKGETSRAPRHSTWPGCESSSTDPADGRTTSFMGLRLMALSRVDHSSRTRAVLRRHRTRFLRGFTICLEACGGPKVGSAASRDVILGDVVQAVVKLSKARRLELGQGPRFEDGEGKTPAAERSRSSALLDSSAEIPPMLWPGTTFFEQCS